MAIGNGVYSQGEKALGFIRDYAIAWATKPFLMNVRVIMK
jgi:hypothetical protein